CREREVICTRRKSRSCCWAVRIGITISKSRMPCVLLFSKCNPCNRTDKGTVFFGIIIVELNAYRVGVVIILIDQHQRPLPIGPQHGVGSYKNVAVVVFNIAGRVKETMFRILWFCPFLRQHLRSKKLRSALFDEPVMVSREHVISSPAIQTSGMR